MSGQFYCKRLTPNEVTYRYLLEIADMQCRGFEEDEMVKALRGPQYAVNPRYTVILQGVRDPRERLNEMISWAENYRNLVHAAARQLHFTLLGRGNDVFIAVDGETDKPVGLAIWEYPAHMQEDLEIKMGRKGLLWPFYKLWIKLKYAIPELLLTLQRIHPFKNALVTQIKKERLEHLYPKTKAEELIGLSQEKLENAFYPLELMVHLKHLVISPDYHRRGLGKKLLNYGLENIPNLPAPLSKSVSGPQKLYLESSPSGFILYQKTGWVFTGRILQPSFLPPHACDNSLMILTR
jgi:GNAT superfamily N-acetyltransferase